MIITILNSQIQHLSTSVCSLGDSQGSLLYDYMQFLSLKELNRSNTNKLCLVFELVAILCKGYVNILYSLKECQLLTAKLLLRHPSDTTFNGTRSRWALVVIT